MPDDKIRVLIVDDEPEVAALLDEIVTGFGHRTAVAHNGVQAIRAVREFTPHVVLLNIRMPGIDGHTVLEQNPRPGSEAPQPTRHHGAGRSSGPARDGQPR